MYHVGDPDPTLEEGPSDCPSTQGDYVCTWFAGHEGDHVAGMGPHGIAAVWAQEDDSLRAGEAEIMGPGASLLRSPPLLTYKSPHGIEQSRRDFMRDYPDLYAYIAAREAAKALDIAVDRISGYHEAANIVWDLEASKRNQYEALYMERHDD